MNHPLGGGLLGKPKPGFCWCLPVRQHATHENLDLGFFYGVFMAGDWIKLQKDTFDKPEVLAIATRMGIDPDAVVGKLGRIWSWFDTHTVDGNASCVTFSFIDRYVGVTGFAEQVALVGWLVQNGHDLTLPNFGYHNGETAKTRALAKNRGEKHRSNANGNAPSVTKSLPEKRREEKSINTDTDTDTDTDKEEDKKEDTPRKRSATFAIPDWINSDHWNVWHSSPKRKKATTKQKQLAVNKLDAWRQDGLDYAGALENAAMGGYQGLFLPDIPKEKRYLPPQPNETIPAKHGIDPALAKLNAEAAFVNPPSPEMREKLEALKRGVLQ